MRNPAAGIIASVLLVAFLALGAAPGLSGPAPRRFTILYTGDEHSALIPHSPAIDGQTGTTGGMARLAGMVERLGDELDEPVILVSSGDFMAGTPFAWLGLEGMAPELDIMTAIGYQVIALGNHEFDYGPGKLADYLRAAGYPRDSGPAILASNMEVPPDHPLSEVGIGQTTIIDLGDGLKVGFFSLLGDDAVRVAPPTHPVTFSSPHETAREMVTDLRRAGAEIVVAITHSGIGDDQALARDVPGIDVIVGGHCHTPLPVPLVEGSTIIVQAGPHLSNLGVLHLSYSPLTKNLVVDNENVMRPYLLPVDEHQTPSPEVETMINHYLETASSMLDRLTSGRHDNLLAAVASSGPVPHLELVESPMGNLVTDAMRRAALSLGHQVDIVFQANGQIRSNLVPGQSAGTAGLVSVYDMVTPVSVGLGPDGDPGYPLVQVYLTGDEVRRVLEVSVLLSGILGDSYYLQSSGLRYTYDPHRAVLLWVPFLDLPLPTYRAVLAASLDDGQPIRWGDEQLYSVVTDLYVASLVPMVGDMLPRLAVSPRDENGQPVKDLSQRILYDDGQELKLWQAVLYHAGDSPKSGGLAAISDRYTSVDGRQTVVTTFPLIIVAAGGILLVVTATGLAIKLLRRWKRRRKPRRLARQGRTAQDASSASRSG